MVRLQAISVGFGGIWALSGLFFRKNRDITGERRGFQLEKIDSIIKDQALQIHRAISHVMNGIGDPENMRPGERWQVDLSIPVFELATSDGFIFRGPCQVISTYNENDQTWLWPSGNPSIPRIAYLETEKVRAATPGLQALSDGDKFEIDTFRAALELATFVALQAGYDGAYPSKYEDGPIVFVAVKPRSPGDPNKMLDWCSLCGRFSKEVTFLDKLAPSFNVCSTCMELFRDIVDSSFDEQAAANPEHLCSACGQLKPARVAANYAYFCKEDVAKFIKRLDL